MRRKNKQIAQSATGICGAVWKDAKNDYYGLRYAEFVVPLVKTLQEQQEMTQSQQQINEQQKKLIEELSKRIDFLEGKND